MPTANKESSTAGRLSFAFLASLGLHAAGAIFLASLVTAPIRHMRPQALLVSIAPRISTQPSPTVSAPAQQPTALAPLRSPELADHHHAPSASVAEKDHAELPLQQAPPPQEASAPPHADYYYPVTELDRKPKRLSTDNLFAPTFLAPQGGYLVLRLLINESGAVDQVQVLVDDPGGPLTEHIVASLNKEKFRPGIFGGTPVKSQIIVELKMAPDSRLPPPSPGTVQLPPVQLPH